MPMNLPQSEEEFAHALNTAAERARKEQRLEDQVQWHERRLNAINGSQERTAKGIDDLNLKMEKIEKRIDEERAVGHALADQAIRTAVGRKEFWIAVVTIAVLLLGAMIPLIIALTGK